MLRGILSPFMRPAALLLTLLVTATPLAACSTPPTKERHQAEGAIAAARAATADTYATDELRAAEAALVRYDTAVAQGDYRQALNAALDARDRAYAAARQASTAKAEARSRAERLALELTTLIQTATSRLSPRATSAAASRLRQALADSTSSLQEARTLLEDGQYLPAITALEAGLAPLRKELPPAAPAAGRRTRS